MKTGSCPSFQSDVAAAVAEYRVLGWSIVRASGKVPHQDWRKYATRRPKGRDLARWFQSSRNLAVVLGPVSDDLCVRDFDVHASYERWATDYPEWAQALPTSRTARGAHVYFRTDGADPALAGIRAYRKLDDGEIRIANCCCTLPPSRHPSGVVYRWLVAPWSGVPLVASAAAAGLVPGLLQPLAKNSFRGANAPVLDTSQCKPTQCQKYGAPEGPTEGPACLFNAAGDVDADGFDRLLSWTLPTGPGQRESCLWQVARVLKGLPETRVVPVDELEPIIVRWWQLALPVVRTKDWVLTWGAFLRAWENVRVPLTGDAELRAVVDRARRAGCPADLRAKYGRHLAGLVIAICRELAIDGNGSFWLSCRALADAVGISKTDAAAYLRVLCAERIIRRTFAGQKGRAAEYVYLRSAGTSSD